MRVTFVNEGNTSHRTHYETSSHFFVRSEPNCFEYEYLFSVCNILHGSHHWNEKDLHWKDHWCSLETVRVSFMRDERSKHRFHFSFFRRRSAPKELLSLDPKLYDQLRFSSPDSTDLTDTHQNLLFIFSNISLNNRLRNYKKISMTRRIKRLSLHSMCLFSISCLLRIEKHPINFISGYPVWQLHHLTFARDSTLAQSFWLTHKLLL